MNNSSNNNNNNDDENNCERFETRCHSIVVTKTRNDLQ